MFNIEKSLTDPSQLQEISKQILEEAKKSGAENAEVSLAANKGFTVRAHGGSVETVEYHQDKSADIAVYFGKRSGTASITDLRPQSIKDAVAAACHIAKFTDPDDANGLADKDELAFNYPHLEMAYPWDISVEKAIEMAIECERQALSQDKRIISAEDVTVATGAALHVYANSKGFIGYYPYTRHEIACVLVAKEGDEMQRDYYYTISVDPKLMMSTHDVAQHAAQRTVQRLGARRVKTTKAPVIYSAEEARGLLGHFSHAMSGGAIYKKNSFLVDQLGKKIFPDFITIQEHPHLPLAVGSAPFDGNGVVTRENKFIENGILQSYALSVYSARKLKMKTTGNAGGTHNLTINHGGSDFNALLKKMGRGLVITEMMGQGVNTLTGDYSRGASGFWVENGEIQHPVNEVTVASRLQDIYANIVEVGNDVDIRGNIRTGSILIKEMTIAGH